MIQYSLKCSQDHDFDSWFQSADAFDKLRTGALLSCPICGDEEIAKAIMAPRVRASRDAAPQVLATRNAATGRNMLALTAPSSPAEAALRELKNKIQANSEYVGANFASEARKIHDGDGPERSIYGEAKPEEVRKLIEEGVPVAPLPFLPDRKVN